MIGVPLAPRAIGDVAARHGGALRNGVKGTVRRLVPIRRAGAGDLTVLLNARYVEDAELAVARGAMLLVDEALAVREDVASLPGWFHAHATWAMAELLDSGDAAPDAPVIGSDCRIGPGVHLLPRVVVGERVTIAPGAVIGAAGFGFVTGPDGQTREIPQLGGVVIEDDVHIGALCTIAAGTIGPTIIRRGAKLDAQVHVGHNCEIGEGTIIAAQSGLAGSVVIGRGVLVGGQVGIADHLTVGDGARIAAKSGVIGDVAAGATVAGYPAVPRHRWLRALAELYRLVGSDGTPPPPAAQRSAVTSPPFDPARTGTSTPPGAVGTTSARGATGTTSPPGAAGATSAAGAARGAPASERPRRAPPIPRGED
ncbi:MAG: UDP-3-O-(3-hydroxymyristoyl)glucosamine N-acyltransferase [Labilithrix sp.]|nr:UDP-3-O-(3-hydroxymyristoyl)glucosamine N-acyltransferase [Labilithrix sp.]